MFKNRRWKIISALLIIIALTLVFSACGEKADENASEGLEFKLSVDGKSYSISGIGTCTDTDIVVPSTYKRLPVTSIGENAFRFNDKITSITIPDSVTGIEDNAFSGCSGLTSITIPEGVTRIGNSTFSECRNLTSITIPSNVTSIGDYAFKSCVNLTSITIPDKITDISQFAFENCNSLQYNEYENALYLGNANNPCIALVKAKSNSITDCTIHNNTKFIFNGAFQDCSEISSITIPEGVLSIGENAFKNCSVLTVLTIPNSVLSIGKSAFDNCDLLKYNTYESMLYIGNETNPYLVLFFASVTSSTINDNTKFIYSGAFSQNDSTSIRIPNNVTSIGDYAFSHFGSLNSVSISSSVKSIGDYAFRSCSRLKYLTILSTDVSIGEKAFSECRSLTNIVFQGTMEQWNALPKGDSWDSECGDYVIKCTDGEIYKNQLPSL